MNIVVFIFDGDAGERERENRAAFESSRRFGVFDDAGSTSAFGDGNLAVDFNRCLDGGGEGLAGRADLGADGLIENNGDHRIRGDDERLRWRRRRLRLLGCGIGGVWRRRRG